MSGEILDLKSEWVNIFSTAAPAEGTSVKQNAFNLEDAGGTEILLFAQDGTNTTSSVIDQISGNIAHTYSSPGVCIDFAVGWGNAAFTAGTRNSSIALEYVEDGNTTDLPAYGMFGSPSDAVLLNTTGNTTIGSLVLISPITYNIAGTFDGSITFGPDEPASYTATATGGHTGFYIGNYYLKGFDNAIRASASGHAEGFNTLNNVVACKYGNMINISGSGNPGKDIDFKFRSNSIPGEATAPLGLYIGGEVFFSFNVDASTFSPLRPFTRFRNSDIPGDFTPRQVVSHGGRLYAIGDNGGINNPTNARVVSFTGYGASDIGTYKIDAVTSPDYVYGACLAVVGNMLACVFNYNGTISSSSVSIVTNATPKSLLVMLDADTLTAQGGNGKSFPRGSDTFFTTSQIKSVGQEIVLSGSISSTTSSSIFGKNFSATGTTSAWIARID